MNRTIDNTFGVKGMVRIVPWIKGSYDAGRADPGREVVTAPGVLFYGEDAVVAAGGGSGGFQGRMAEFDVWLSIDTAHLQRAGARQGDRIEVRAETFETNGETFEINRISGDGISRSKVYMLRAPEE
ncbi:hypothetical protein [Bradyrhizobium paxllaeri]|uniref:hypothetical protein n=1 Tax=Bradyrhizobium paxllaeri TaxID=190148 RepID=UPI0011476C02|nr:hypothetical protein [Bradyrhizobium paxllaeri]